MNDYRPLTTEEIEQLQQNGCWAEDWTSVNVAEDFNPEHMRQVMLYGEVSIGSFDKSIEVSPGFHKHSGIRNATLHNVIIGDDCLIENIGGFINNYTIGDECYLSNVSTIETTEGATYGEANVISVLNEAGDGNIISFSELSSQLAALMLKHSHNKEFRETLFQLVRAYVSSRLPERGLIGNNVKIANTKEIINCIINDYCEVNGAERLSDCTLLGDATSSVYIGTGVIAENTIIDHGASITNGANLQDCFVGEACQINNSFTASASVFFANSVMSNGEACAAFCGPFSASHHKSSLIIGSQVSFYNAGSATNFSNHAYKMGPIHWGILERGTKTASGSYLFLPAHIGAYSVCLGKTMAHPDTTSFPFSYIIGEGEKTILIPGRNLVTVGLYRDINKWPKRDLRPAEHRKSIINQEWLSPFVIRKATEGRRILQELCTTCGTQCQEYHYQGLTIPRSSLLSGIRFYDMLISLYLGQVIKKATLPEAAAEEEGHEYTPLSEQAIHNGEEAWTDLGGLLLPQALENQLVEDIIDGTTEDIESVINALSEAHSHYADFNQAYAFSLIRQLYEEATPAAFSLIETRADEAKSLWTEAIRKDAQKEYDLGDVDEDTFLHFANSISPTT